VKWSVSPTATTCRPCPLFSYFSLCLSLDLQGRISLSLTHALSLSHPWRTHVSSPPVSDVSFSLSLSLCLSLSFSVSLSHTHVHTHTHTHTHTLSLDWHKRLLPRASDAEVHDLLLDLLDDEDLTQQRRRGRAERLVFVPVWYVSCHELASRTTYIICKTVTVLARSWWTPHVRFCTMYLVPRTRSTNDKYHIIQNRRRGRAKRLVFIPV